MRLTLKVLPKLIAEVGRIIFVGSMQGYHHAILRALRNDKVCARKRGVFSRTEMPALRQSHYHQLGSSQRGCVCLFMEGLVERPSRVVWRSETLNDHSRVLTRRCYSLRVFPSTRALSFSCLYDQAISPGNEIIPQHHKQLETKICGSGEFKSLRDNFLDIIKMPVLSTSLSVIRLDRFKEFEQVVEITTFGYI